MIPRQKKVPQVSRIAGAIDGSPLGVLDNPALPQDGGVNHVIFYPFESGIGTTTIVQRLCGSNPTDPNPSSGINGYRAVWSLELDSVGSILYENIFLWDVCYETILSSQEQAESLLNTAKLIVMVIPSENRSIIQRVIGWYQEHIQESQRAVAVITRCDRVESAQIRPSDVENLSRALNISVVQVSGANIDSSKLKENRKESIHPSIRKLALAIKDNLQ
ncbi:hypothetical protein GPJ56_000503 [Histomonas meleagridis]|uniref:uncharacterized protein n=1 Tax=Histomonas meleagridis TaxID=135588 RepID=UPI003559B87E|nr:hypothetical protein GPJ56_000503 [Histomonas meleagridis]KAH0796457.1 hypothetical protein GO595_010350 [Histomonas meleagridis]